MKQNKSRCLICVLKELDTRLSSSSLSRQQAKLFSRQYELLIAKLKTKNSRPLHCCGEHKELLAKIRAVLHKRVESRKHEQVANLINSFTEMLEIKAKIRAARQLGKHDEIPDLKIKLFQKTCLVGQRRRRFNELTLKELNLKDLDTQIRELLRSSFSKTLEPKAEGAT